MDNQQLEHLIRKIDDLVSSHTRMSGAMQSLTANARKTDSNTKSSSNKSNDFDSSSNFMKFVASMTTAEKAADKFATTISGSVTNVLGVMTGDLYKLQSAVKSTIEGVFGKLGLGGVGGILSDAFGGLTDLAGSLTTDFQTLSDSGKTFSGGVLDMAQAAFESGNTIGQYTEYMHKNSLIAASMANNKNGGLAILARNTRDAGIKFGEFGYSITELNDLTAQYAERRRLTGSMEELDEKNAHDQVINLARDTTALSKAFGISRTELTHQATDLIKGNPYLVGRDSPALDTMMTGLLASGGGGPMGATIAKLAGMGTQFGMLSDEYRDLVAAGPVGARVGAIAMNARSVAEDDPKNAYRHSMEINNQMYEMGQNKAIQDELMKQFAGGNKEAGALLSYLGQVHQIDIEKAVKDHDNDERIDAITKAFLSAGVSWSNMVSGFSLGVSKGLEPIFKKFKDDPKYTKAIDDLMGENGPIYNFGKKLGDFVGSLLTPEKVKEVGDWIDNIFSPDGIDKANKFITGIFDGTEWMKAKQWMIDEITSMFGAGNVKMVTDALGSLGDMGKMATKIGNAFDFVNHHLTLAASAIIGLGATFRSVGSFFQYIIGKIGGMIGFGAVAAKTGAKAVPGLGDAILGYEAYSETGSIGAGLAATAGSVVGRIGGAAAGTAVGGPVGGVVGEVGGASAGAQIGKAGYQWAFGKPGNPEEKKEVEAAKPQAAVIDVNHPSVTTLLGNLSQSTQDAISPAMDQMANSISGTAELTNDKQTDAIITQIDMLKRVIVMQTEVMAAILNDLNGTVKTGNSTLETISTQGH